MGKIQHVKTNAGTNDPVNTYLVQPQDWNSFHIYTLQDGMSVLAPNTAGTLTPISSGTCYLAGGNNITLSQNANSITISGTNFGTISQWPGILPGSATGNATISYYAGSVNTSSISTSQTGYTFSIYFAPMGLYQAVAFSVVRFPVSNSIMNSRGSITQVYSIGFYTNNNSTLSLVNAVYGGIFLSQSSSGSVSYSLWTATTGSNSAGGSGGFAGIEASSVTSSGGAVSSFINGIKNMYFPLPSTTLTAGNYWCALAFCSVSIGTSGLKNVWIMQSNVMSTGVMFQDFGANTATTNDSLYGWGAISTTFTSQSSAATWFPLPSSVAVSNMTTSVSATTTNYPFLAHFPILRGI